MTSHHHAWGPCLLLLGKAATKVVQAKILMHRQGSNWRDQGSRTNFCHHISSTKFHN